MNSMIFTTEQSASLLSLIGKAPYLGQSPTAILDLLNTPVQVANPTPQGTVPVGFTSTMLATACSAANRVNLATFLGAAAPLIIAQSTGALADGIATLELCGAISAADSTAMIAVLNATKPDPTWPATIAGPTPFQSLFPKSPFTMADGSVHSGTCTPDMLTEVLG